LSGRLEALRANKTLHEHHAVGRCGTRGVSSIVVSAFADVSTRGTSSHGPSDNL
jgi:hypothetical protein